MHPRPYTSQHLVNAAAQPGTQGLSTAASCWQKKQPVAGQGSAGCCKAVRASKVARHASVMHQRLRKATCQQDRKATVKQQRKDQTSMTQLRGAA